MISSCLIDETDVPHDITPRGLERAPLVYDRADDGSNGEAEISEERTVEAEVEPSVDPVVAVNEEVGRPQRRTARAAADQWKQLKSQNLL